MSVDEAAGSAAVVVVAAAFCGGAVMGLVNGAGHPVDPPGELPEGLVVDVGVTASLDPVGTDVVVVDAGPVTVPVDMVGSVVVVGARVVVVAGRGTVMVVVGGTVVVVDVVVVGGTVVVVDVDGDAVPERGQDDFPVGDPVPL
ncbi:MAG: hypothetical protein ACRDZ8_11735 [Acidimicrobiales bacterium]